MSRLLDLRLQPTLPRRLLPEVMSKSPKTPDRKAFHGHLHNIVTHGIPKCYIVYDNESKHYLICPPFPKIHMRLDRLLSITMMLINRRKVTAPELAEHFEVSIRTIYRDIEAIHSAGIPVVSCQGYDGGFCIMENYRMNRQVLTFQEIFSTLAALKGINTTLENREMDNAIEKIECLIPEDKEEEFERLSEQIAFDIIPWGSQQRQQEHFKLLHQSISAQKLVSFTYTNNLSITTARVVEPMTLLFKSYCWYLFGYCQTRKDFRIFKLSRMRQLSFLNERFSRKQKSFRELLSADGPDKKLMNLELLFAPQAKVKVEDFFEPDQILIRDDGAITVTIDFPEDEWIFSWLLSYGDEVEVLKPKHIREQFIEKLKKIQKKYIT
jgi:predicted DNA-binding transcriptional regulator YafY